MKTIEKLKRWMPKAHSQDQTEIWATMVSRETEMPPEDEGYLSYMELRQNAIDAIKELREIDRVCDVSVKAPPRAVSPFFCSVFDECGDEHYEVDNLINWIKYFFNIKEEDLK